MFGNSQRPREVRGYRRILVPLDVRPASFDALQIACRLAVDDHARITAVNVIEIPALLPLDTRFDDVEESVRRLLERAGATGDAYGVDVVPRLVRGRDFGAAIVAEAILDRSEVIVLGAPRAEFAVSHRTDHHRPVFRVLKGAPCRVMVVSAPLREAS